MEAPTGPPTAMLLYLHPTVVPFGLVAGLMWAARAAFPRAVPRVAAVLFGYAAAAGCWVWSAAIWDALGEL